MGLFRVTHSRAGRHSSTTRGWSTKRSLVLVAAVGLSVTAGSQWVSATPPSQFSVLSGDAFLRPAHGTPMPDSGTEAFLPRVQSAAQTTVSGSGSVDVGVMGTSCPGVPPVIEVSVDGKTVGRATINVTKRYVDHYFGSGYPAGAHTVLVTLLTDSWTPNVCDTNALLGFVKMGSQAGTTPAPTPTPTPPPTPPAPTRPGPGNTGVPAGVSLTPHYGDIDIRQNGTVIDGMDVYGSIKINADNVTIRNSRIRGGAAPTTFNALVTAWWHHSNLLIEDSTLKADNPSLWWDGLSGSGFTAERLDISGVIDTVKVIGPNVTLTDSYLHDNLHYLDDPNQAGGASHDDSVQVEGGNNITLRHNTLQNSHNAAVMVTQNNSVTSNLKVDSNWLSGGGCQVNVTQRAQGGPIQGMTITNNRFGPGLYGTVCPMYLPSTSPIAYSGNVFDATNAPAVPRFF